MNFKFMPRLEKNQDLGLYIGDEWRPFKLDATELLVFYKDFIVRTMSGVLVKYW